MYTATGGCAPAVIMQDSMPCEAASLAAGGSGCAGELPLTSVDDCGAGGARVAGFHR